jgi:hypothetical protein
MPLVLAGATSGQATIQATDAATVTLTLPATTGTLAVSGGSPSFTTITTTSDILVNSLTVGRSGGNLAGNTALGTNTPLGANTTGYFNTAIGQGALQINTTGNQNTALGIATLNANITGSANTAIGDRALNANTGSNNTSIGSVALYSNTSGQYNTAVGQSALLSNTTASYNTAVGYQALYANTTGRNTAYGAFAGYQITTGTQNTAIGDNALQASTTSNNNTAVGYQALANNNRTSDGNGFNTAVGMSAGSGLTTGQLCTFLGQSAGSTLTTGTSCTYIGQGANASGVNVNNELVISTGTSTGKGTNTGFIWINGGGSIYNSGNTTAWQTTSDRRIKENIIDLNKGLDVITALRPVEFDYIETKKHDVSFIAQEYEEVLPDQVTKHSPNDFEKTLIGDDEQIYGLNVNLVPYLVKAIQELKATVDAQAARIAVLEGAK